MKTLFRCRSNKLRLRAALGLEAPRIEHTTNAEPAEASQAVREFFCHVSAILLR